MPEGPSLKRQRADPGPGYYQQPPPPSYGYRNGPLPQPLSPYGYGGPPPPGPYGPPSMGGPPQRYSGGQRGNGQFYNRRASGQPQQLQQQPYGGSPYHKRALNNGTVTNANNLHNNPGGWTYNSSRVTPRVYSEFRISKAKIGSLEITEAYNPKSTRDSRLRLYFKTAKDKTPQAVEGKTAKEKALAEPDRLSISLYQGSKRMVIPVQDGLKKVKFNRADGHFIIESYCWALFEQANSKGQFHKCEDFTDGKLEEARGVIELWVDRDHALPMLPRWTRGNIEGHVYAQSKFRTQQILEVVDPVDITDFTQLLSVWIKESIAGSETNRQEFASTKLNEKGHLLELASKVLLAGNYPIDKPPPAELPPLYGAGGSVVNMANAVKALFATIVEVSEGLEESVFVEKLKLVLFQIPEAILWRGLDESFAQRTSTPSFNAKEILAKLRERRSNDGPGDGDDHDVAEENGHEENEEAKDEEQDDNFNEGQQQNEYDYYQYTEEGNEDQLEDREINIDDQ